jgi:hypothetical protein
MQLENLSIRLRNSWEPGYKEGSYQAMIKYKNKEGTIELQLTPTLTAKILNVVAEDLVVASKEIATNLTSAVITAQTALPAPKVPSAQLETQPNSQEHF